MASPQIKIKRSSVAGKVPHYPSTLDVGEFAINTADGKVFIAAGVGAGVTVREVGISTTQVLASGIGTFKSLVVTDQGHAIVGISTGSAKVETAIDGGNQWHHVGFLDNRTGYQKVKTNGLTYNPNTGKLYAGIGSFGAVTGNLTGDVTGNLTGSVNSSGISTFASGALDFYRSSGNTYIDNDSGHLIIRNQAGGVDDGRDIYIMAKPGETGILVSDDSAVYLYFDGSPKMRTDTNGILVYGDVALSGTVDGRDVATDGAKLDGIDSNVSSVVNATHGLTGNVNSTGISTISGFTFPSTDGSEDQALVTDGNGSLSFKTLSGGGGAVGGATTISASNTIATQGQTAFTAPNVFDDGEQATAFSVLVTLNGMKMRLGGSQDYTLSAPQTVNFTSGVNVGDNVQISVYFGHTFEEELFTSTQNQATFTLAGSLAAAKNYRVFLNGVRLRRDVDYQASAAVVLTQNCASGDEVDICSDQAEDHLTASDGQSAFAPSNSDTSSDNMEVYLNGVLLQKTSDWSIGSPAVTIINPATGLDVGDELDVVVRRS